MSLTVKHHDVSKSGEVEIVDKTAKCVCVGGGPAAQHDFDDFGMVFHGNKSNKFFFSIKLETVVFPEHTNYQVMIL